MAAHAAGDRAAFSALVARHRQRFWNLTVRTLRDREEASDALQDGFVRAFRAAGGYRGEAEVTSWLHRIMLNVCLARIARRQRQPQNTPIVLDERSPDRESAPAAGRDEFARVDARLDVSQLLAALPEEQRLPIVLVDLEGHSVAEAAELLGVAPGTVKSRCARGRSRMAATLLAGRAGPAPLPQPQPRGEH